MLKLPPNRLINNKRRWRKLFEANSHGMSQMQPIIWNWRIFGKSQENKENHQWQKICQVCRILINPGLRFWTHRRLGNSQEREREKKKGGIIQSKYDWRMKKTITTYMPSFTLSSNGRHEWLTIKAFT